MQLNFNFLIIIDKTTVYSCLNFKYRPVLTLGVFVMSDASINADSPEC